MGDDAKPNYHCAGCKMCMVGFREFSRHCDACQACYSKKSFSTHQCVRREGDCVICFDSIERSMYGTFVPPCCHFMHYHCYQQLVDEGKYECPVCRRFILTGKKREFRVEQLKLITRFFFNSACNRLVTFSCNDCGKRYTTRINQYRLYYCEACDLFNTMEVDFDSQAPL